MGKNLNGLLKDRGALRKFYTLPVIRSSSKRTKKKEAGLLTSMEELHLGRILVHIALSDLKIAHRKQYGVFLSMGFAIKLQGTCHPRTGLVALTVIVASWP